MKKYNVSLILLAVVILLLGISHFIYFQLEKKWNGTHRFIFSLPIPPEIKNRYSLDNDIEIEKVIIAGPFSSWNGNDDAFKMQKIGEMSWSIDLPMPSGRNLYKFVVHTKKFWFDSKDHEYRNKVWVHDKYADHLEADGYGGFNSLIKVPNFKQFRRVTNISLLGIGLLILLYIILKPLIRVFINMRIPYRIKLVLVTGVILLTTNLMFIGYNIIEFRLITRESYIDATHFILRPLIGKTEYLDQKMMDYKKMEKQLQDSLFNVAARFEKNKNTFNQIKISSVWIMDTNFHALAHGFRTQYEKLEKLRLENSVFSDLESLYLDYYYSNIILDLKAGKYSDQSPSFTLKKILKDPERPQLSDKTRIWSGYDTLIIPLRAKRKLQGYAIFDLHTNLLGMEISRILKFNLLMLLLVMFLMYFLLYDLGGVLSMEEEARIDGLTGVFNRRTLDIIIKQELLRARREKQFLGVIILDLDHFKKINDILGHLAGDKILQDVVKVIESCLRRPADEMGRYGGEEFVIILPNTDTTGVAVVAEDIRKKIEDHNFKWEDKHLPVQISLGYYAAIPEVNSEISEYYQKADKALYLAKDQGRNRSVGWKKNL